MVQLADETIAAWYQLLGGRPQLLRLLWVRVGCCHPKEDSLEWVTRGLEVGKWRGLATEPSNAMHAT